MRPFRGRGYQQSFRESENVGAYRLTTLPGRAGPAGVLNGGRRGVMGEFAQNRPEDGVHGDAASGVWACAGYDRCRPRGEYEQTKRLTNRSQTGARTDNLGFAGAKRIVSETAFPWILRVTRRTVPSSSTNTTTSPYPTSTVSRTVTSVRRALRLASRAYTVFPHRAGAHAVRFPPRGSSR